MTLDKIRHRLLAVMIVALAAVSLTSCDTDDWDPYYYSPLLGGWQLDSVNGVPVDEPQVAIFDFYGNGNGTYQYYTNFAQGVWSTYPITWECDFPNDFDNYLYVYTWNGDTWIYRFQVSAGMLTLFDTLTGNTLTFVAI